MHGALPVLSAQGQVDASRSQVCGRCRAHAGEATALCRNVASLAFLPAPQLIAISTIQFDLSRVFREAFPESRGLYGRISAAVADIRETVCWRPLVLPLTSVQVYTQVTFPASPSLSEASLMIPHEQDIVLLPLQPIGNTLALSSSARERLLRVFLERGTVPLGCAAVESRKSRAARGWRVSVWEPMWPLPLGT